MCELNYYQLDKLLLAALQLRSEPVTTMDDIIVSSLCVVCMQASSTRNHKHELRRESVCDRTSPTFSIQRRQCGHTHTHSVLSMLSPVDLARQSPFCEGINVSSTEICCLTHMHADTPFSMGRVNKNLVQRNRATPRDI